MLIAIDGDGVMLDYNTTYGNIWTMCFGKAPQLCDSRAYHATRYWGVTNPSKDHRFWALFDQHGWSNMPAMEGAVEACHLLKAAGHDLVCVTSMPEHRKAARLNNLLALGFPIDDVIATGTPPGYKGNPKKQALELLRPDWFIDDEMRKLRDLPASIQCVLINPGHSDNPNEGYECDGLMMEASTLLDFAHQFLQMQSSPPSTRDGWVA